MAVQRGSKKGVAKGTKVAAHIFEAAEEDIVFDHGQFYVKGSPDKRKALGEIAFASFGMNLPEGMEQSLEAVAYYDPSNFVFPLGTHIAIVEADAETGDVALKRYIAVADCRAIINPMIVEAQAHGGVAAGVAQGLYWELVYAEASGQTRKGRDTDYLTS